MDYKNFIGPLPIEDLPRYEDNFGNVEYDVREDDDSFCIIHNGQSIPYEMTLSMDYPDDCCCRVMIDGVYYYFG